MSNRQSLIIAGLSAVLVVLLCVTSLAPASAAPLYSNPGTAGLVAWWSLDETSGTRYDSHGSNHLTDNNSVGYTSGKIGNAANFTASNSESLSIAANADVGGGDEDLTLFGWIRLTDLSAARRPVALWGDDGERAYQLLWNTSTQRLQWVVSGNGSSYSTTGAIAFGPLPTDSFVFVVAWHDSTEDKIRIQVNDTSVHEAPFSAGIHTATVDFYLGRYGSGQYWQGDIDEFAICRCVYTAAQRTWLYNSGAGRSYSELLPTPTPTLTPTDTPVPTDTPTPTPTDTPVPTDTPTPTPTDTPVPTDTPTPTPTDTPVPTDTPEPTDTGTPEPTPTETLTPTPTPEGWEPSPTPTPDYEYVFFSSDGLPYRVQRSFSYGDIVVFCGLSAVAVMLFAMLLVLIFKREPPPSSEPAKDGPAFD